MSDYIKQIASSSPQWTIPVAPALSDPFWKTAFTASDNAGKQNIAHGWLWSLHQHILSLQSVRSEVLAAVRIIENSSWFREIYPYVDTDQTRAAGLLADGSFEQIFEATISDDDINPQHLGDFKYLLKQVWLGDNVARNQKLIEFVEFLIPELQQAIDYGALTSLSLCAVWDTAQNTEYSTKHMRAAAKLSVEAALLGVTIPVNGSAVQKAVHALALRASDPTKLDVAKYRGLAVKTHLKTLAPEMLAEIIIDIHEGAIKKRAGVWLRDSQNPLFLNKHDTQSVYNALRDWVPELAWAWDTSENLDLDARSALALSPSQKQVGSSPTVTLPDLS